MRIIKNFFIIVILSLSVSILAQTDEKETLKQLNQSIITAYKSGKLDEAQNLAQRALDLSIKMYGEENVETATAYSNLGVILKERKKYKESAANLQKAVEIYQKPSNTEVEKILELLDSLVVIQTLGGMKKEAEMSHLKRIEVVKVAFGEESKEIIKPLLDLAVFYSQVDNYEKSQDYYLKTSALVIKLFGKESKEMETVQIYSSYYRGETTIRTNDKIYKEYKKKHTELLGYEQGDPIRLIIPSYPVKAIKEGRQGKIVVKVKIDEQGDVTDAKAIFGEMFFASVAEEVAKKAKFKPSIKNGKPISVYGYITYKFVK